MRYAGSIISVAIIVAGCAVLTLAQESPRIVNGGVLNGKAISLPKPQYPADAKSAGIGGMVRVEVIIDENGNIESAKAQKEETADAEAPVENADAKASLRDAAEQAAMKARYSPTLLSGQPVKVRGVITYNFVADMGSEDETKAINGGILNGKAILLPDPGYPPAALAVKAEGIVAVRVTIDENGDVVSAKAVSGHPLLQSAAVSAAREAKFSPTLLNGSPVRVSGVITYNFVRDKTPQ